MRRNEPSVPLSVFREMAAMHERHLADVTAALTAHLSKVAELYKEALKPPPLPTMEELQAYSQFKPDYTSTPGHQSDEELELRYLADQGLIPKGQLKDELAKLGLDLQVSVTPT